MSIVIKGTNTKELLEIRSGSGGDKLLEFATTFKTTIDSMVKERAVVILSEMQVAEEAPKPNTKNR